MKKGRISSEITNKAITNNVIFDNVFNACTLMLNEDNELALEIANETAYPHMSDYNKK